MHSPLFWLCAAALVAAALAATNNNGGFDHRAHAVPGGPYEVADNDAGGSALVNLNGGLSHSHFFAPRTGATGKIVKYVWTVGGKTICTKMVCGVKFPLGKTFIKLKVIDNTGDASIATTFVNVFSGSKPGVRFWYHPGNGFIQGRISRKQLPSYSSTNSMINLAAMNAFPRFVRSKKFSVRVLGSLDFRKAGVYRFRLGCGGADCSLYMANKFITAGKNKVIDSNGVLYTRAKRNFVILFRRHSPKGPAPRLSLSWKTPGSGGWRLVPANFLSHTPAAYNPVVHFVTPSKARVGGVITVHGSSLLNIKAIKIGGTVCAGPRSKNQFSATCIVPGGDGRKKLSVVTSAGTSNSVNVDIAGFGGTSGGRSGGGPIGYYQPISFSKNFLKQGGKTWKASQLTAITLGPDGKYYIGSLNGFVHVLTTDFGNGVTNYCKSQNVGKMRSILGVAFNPAETTRLRLYASTSILYWGVKKILPMTKGWHNGEIVAMQRTGSQCLARVQTVISGLPVSNHDHSVNGLSFDHSGNLLITAGGSTNAGVSVPGDPLGGVPDTPLSGSMMIAPVLKRGFKGQIKYTNYGNPGKANKVGGSVYIYAAGLRNSMCHVVHSNGQIYATDNGANAAFGAQSFGCNKQGGVSSEPDTLKKIAPGGFHGYANRNRGRYDGRQCIHRPPQKNMKGYNRHIATFESSTDGLIEYTANTFGAQMRGDLLATKFAVSGNGKVYRMQMSGNGNVKSKFPFVTHSGLTAAMTPTGGLFMPRVYQGMVAVLLPNERNPGKVVVTSVNPFRGPKKGGHPITVTGWNLFPPLSVKVGGKPCTNLKNFKKGRSLTCTVPRGSGKAKVVVTRFGKSSMSFGFEYMYMKV